MNDEQLEGLVRSALRERAPREVPTGLALRAAAIPSQRDTVRVEKVRAPWSRTRWFATLAVVATAVVIVGVVALVPRSATPSMSGTRPVPTLPPVTQPSLPPAGMAGSTITGSTLFVTGQWLTADSAWVAMEDGLIWLTTDGGQSWAGPRPIGNPIGELRGGPVFMDANTGYAVWTTQPADRVEIRVDRTDDGGVTWRSVQAGVLESSPDAMDSATVHFSDALHGMVLAASYVPGPVPSGHAGAGLTPRTCSGWQTDDGGVTWADLPSAPCSNHDVWASPTVGMLMPASDGGAEVSLTVDGGRTWRRGRLPEVTAADAPFDVTFTVAPDGQPRLAYWINEAGAGGASPARIIVAQSPDGGATWEKAYEFEPPMALTVDTLTALTPDHWIGTGWSRRKTASNPDVPVFETGDAGRSWTETGTLGSIDGSTFGWSDRLHGMAMGQDDSGCELPSGTPCHVDGFFLTNDGGRTWHGVPFN